MKIILKCKCPCSLIRLRACLQTKSIILSQPQHIHAPSKSPPDRGGRGGEPDGGGGPPSGPLDSDTAPVDSFVNFLKMFLSGILKFSLLVLPCLVQISCNSSSVNHQIDLLLYRDNIETTRSNLIKISQDHPGNFKAQVHLATINLVSGHLEQARKNIRKAMELLRNSSDPKDVYILHVTSSQIALFHEDYDEAIRAAEAALAINPDDPLNSRLRIARALVALEKREKALESYELCWQSDNSTFSKEDFSSFLRLLMGAEQWNTALDVLYSQFDREGYEVGLGFMLSTLHELNGDAQLSILCAYLDLRYGRLSNKVNPKEADDNLNEIEELITESRSPENASSIMAFQAMDAGDWQSAYTLLMENTIRNPVHDFLALIAGFESGQVGYEGIEPYKSLETYYRSYPEYYYRISRAMRKFPSESGFTKQRPVLEKVILQAPNSAMAEESRRQLCALLFLNEEFAQHLYLLAEQETVLSQFSETGRIETLYPLIRLLDFDNNPYTLAAEDALRKLAGIPVVRDYLESIRDKTPYREKRIGLILS